MRYEYWSRHAFRHVDAFLFRSQFLLSPWDFVFDLCDFSLSPAKWGPSAELLASAVMSSCEAPPRHLRGVQATVVAAISTHSLVTHSTSGIFSFVSTQSEKRGWAMTLLAAPSDDWVLLLTLKLSASYHLYLWLQRTQVPLLTPLVICARAHTHTQMLFFFFLTKVKYSILVDLVWFPLLN